MSQPETRPGAPLPEVPAVTVVMPVLNEERHLAEAVAGVLNQDYAGPLELVLAIGPSTDRTAEVAAAMAEADPRVRIVGNPTGRTPSGLNAAIAAGTGDVVVRVDGHALLPEDYVTVAVHALRDTGADNVGGVMAAEGSTPFESAVACAMTSPLGVGGARFHVGGAAGPAESVYLGVFRRSALRRVDGYDEAFTRAQDWEMNHRIHETGGVVWFEPAMTVAYRPRASVHALGRQYRDYGRWRRVVMRRHPETFDLRSARSLRYLAPPLAVVLLLVGTTLGLAGLLGVLGLVGGSGGGAAYAVLCLGFLAPIGYALLILVGSRVVGRGLSGGARWWLPVALVTMHLCWGWGFLTSRRSLAAAAR